MTKAKEICNLALFSALIIVSQIATSALPNIHLVAMLMIIAVRLFQHKAWYCVVIFALSQCLLYGFSPWSLCYFYVWGTLVLISKPVSEVNNKWFWACIAGIHGLIFGMLWTLPVFVMSGFKAGIAFWINGLYFDIIHAISNFIITATLITPLFKLSQRLIGGVKFEG